MIGKRVEFGEIGGWFGKYFGTVVNTRGDKYIVEWDRKGECSTIWADSVFTADELKDRLVEKPQFKVGSFVREQATGDTGFITEMYPDSTMVRVDWRTGSCTGMNLSITLPELELVEVEPNPWYDGTPEKQIAPDLDGETIVLSGVEYRLVKI